MYPRWIKDGTRKALVSDNQLVDEAEHLFNKHRMLSLNGVISGEAWEMNDSLLALDSFNHDPIKLFIASPGGDLDCTFLICDTIRMLQSPVYTFARYAASAAVLIMAAGKKRYLSPHSKVMIHLPKTYFGNAGMEDRDIEIHHRQAVQYKEQMIEILTECGARKTSKEILADIDRDFYMKPQEVIDYGIADEIMTKETMQGWLARKKNA